jgi:hydroxymethylpyrimidine kinase/phosphomethylpyrimidine kinase/thiamine-phosphate diphosphorylase
MRRDQLRLYLITDPSFLATNDLIALLPALVGAGVTAVQLRDKNADTRTLVAHARALKATLLPLGVPLIVNDRVDVALAADADGVHVGTSDLDPATVRRLLGPGRSLGVSIERPQDVATASEADVLSVSPVFATATKADVAPALGVEGVAEVCAQTAVPVCGIGGIDAARAAEVVRAGGEGVAVVSAILAAPDPVGAARALRAAVEEAVAVRERVPNVLTIAGSDSGGGAGIQADLKTFAAHGAFGCSVLTAVTAQNTRGVTAIADIPTDVVRAQLDAVFGDIRIDAVKIGMLSRPVTIEAVAEALERHRPAHVVLDPVMVATSGDRLLEDRAVSALRDRLLPLASVITPNLPEVGALLDLPAPTTVGAMQEAAQLLQQRGAGSVLLKGGHLDGAQASDVLAMPGATVVLQAARVATDNTHGTGCSLSSAIAARLARGDRLPTAARGAKAWLTQALRSSERLSVGRGHGPVDHAWAQRR